MEEWILSLFQKHANHAHWLLFVSALLAGCNIPISIDLLVIVAAILSLHFIPDNTLLIILFLFSGCLLAAWISYGIGRFLGNKCQHTPLLRTMFSPHKQAKIQKFYQKRGAWAFFLGRFIPFGIRNCLFLTAGMCKLSFTRFIILDFFACLLWLSTSFFCFYKVGENFPTLWNSMQKINLSIFLFFLLAVIGVICYKKRKIFSRPKDNS